MCHMWVYNSDGHKKTHTHLGIVTDIRTPYYRSVLNIYYSIPSRVGSRVSLDKVSRSFFEEAPK